MQNKQIKINKIELSYELFESKKEDSDIILILHGWQGASSSWTKTGDLLNRSGYNVIIPDIPCASKNTKCTEIYNLDDYAELIEKFIEDLKEKYDNINFDKLILW
jgi:esterase/lipase